MNLTVNHSKHVSEDKIYLSKNIIEELGIPSSCTYEVLESGNQIVIGPFIGILSDLTNKNLAEMLPTYGSFVKGYTYIGGAIGVFSLEGIKEETQTVEGYLYHPKKNAWQKKTFPFPAVVMSIAEPSLTSAWEAFFEQMNNFDYLLGGKVFNYPHFSKWEMYEMLLPKFQDKLPETVLYSDHWDIQTMLNKHGSIYIKPSHGRLGKRIYNLVKEGSQIIVKYDEKNKVREKVFLHFDECTSFFNKHLQSGHFLIQQTLHLKTHERSVIDFRVMAAKNERGNWRNLGIFSRYGARGQIVSNITAGGHTESARKTLKEVWKLGDKDIQRVENEMKHIVLELIAVLEEHGYHLGNIGVDIGMDDDGKLSIIEVNHQNPDPYIALFAKDRKAFYKCRFTNMMYAKYLEGF